MTFGAPSSAASSSSSFSDTDLAKEGTEADQSALVALRPTRSTGAPSGRRPGQPSAPGARSQGRPSPRSTRCSVRSRGTCPRHGAERTCLRTVRLFARPKRTVTPKTWLTNHAVWGLKLLTLRLMLDPDWTPENPINRCITAFFHARTYAGFRSQTLPHRGLGSSGTWNANSKQTTPCDFQRMACWSFFQHVVNSSYWWFRV